MTDPRRERLAQLRPRDLDVVRALIEYAALTEADVADMIDMGLANLKARAKYSYRLLGVEGRLHLYALYHHLFTACGGGDKAA